jgi:hypothetical protein
MKSEMEKAALPGRAFSNFRCIIALPDWRRPKMADTTQTNFSQLESRVEELEKAVTQLVADLMRIERALREASIPLPNPLAPRR